MTSADSRDARNGAERKRRGQRAADTEQSFEGLLRELEGIVTSLEDGQLPLEESLDLYERGMRLAKLCQERLDTADLRVRRLRLVLPPSDENDAEYALDDFEPNGND